MKKIIGLVCWLLAFIVPFRYAILDTDDVVLADGRADNIVGLLNFLLMMVLIFVGYALVDSSKGKSPSAEPGH
ncbi:MAG: hypothetical protein IPP83_05580 [Flavobacteriales bacterium]|nr:hypothetical protein [Flavobacteriales bacterium]MBL0126926.1 hypothetical protein [Flavobacteriales bacterium]MCC6938644.1 hypothetical protein [Flavobacteriales bacterium]